jgi:hypothetical protein
VYNKPRTSALQVRKLVQAAAAAAPAAAAALEAAIGVVGTRKTKGMQETAKSQRYTPTTHRVPSQTGRARI